MKTNKYISIVFINLIIISLLFSGCSNKNDIYSSNATLLSPSGDYMIDIGNDCIVSGYSSMEYDCAIDGVSVLDGTFYKYAISDNNDFVAIHVFDLENEESLKDAYSIKINMDTYAIKKSYFALVNAEKRTVEYFDTVIDFNEYTSNKNIHFSNWYFREIKSRNIEINENSYIEDAGQYRGQVLYINNEPIFSGSIRDYALIDSNKIAIKLELANFDFGLEFPEYSNKGLSLEKYKTKKYIHTNGIVYCKVYYSSYIVYDLENNEFKEYDSKKSVEKDYETATLQWNTI